MTDLIERLLDKAPFTTMVVMIFGAMGLTIGWAYICSRAFDGGLTSLLAFFAPIPVAAVAHDIRAALRAKEADNG